MRSTTFDPAFTATATAVDSHAATDARSGRNGAAKSKLWTRLIEARQAQADAIVARHVALHDDEALKSFGWTEAEIAALRQRTRADR